RNGHHRSAGAGTLAHRPAALRPQRHRTRGDPEPRRDRPRGAGRPAQAPGRGDHLRPRPGACAGRPAPRGEEIIYVLEGTLEYSIDGQEPMTYSAGEALTVPAETVHSVRNVGTG